MGLPVGLAAAARVIAGGLGPTVRTLARNVANGAAFETGRKLIDAAYGLRLAFLDEDPYNKPFRPGICAIPYLVTVTYLIKAPDPSQFDGTFTASSIVWGPIGTAGVRRFTVPDLVASDRFFIDLTHYGPVNMPPQGPQRSSIAGPGFAPLNSVIAILNVESEPWPEGTSGECPILPPAPPYRPEDFTFDVTVEYPRPTGNPISLPMTALVGLLYVKADLSLNMPVTFNIRPTINNNLEANFKIQGSLNLDNGDFEVDWTTGDEPNTPPPALPPATRPPLAPINRPAPPKPPGIPDGEPTPDEEVKGGELIGVIVTAELNPNAQTTSIIGQLDNPDIHIPAIGYVSFAVSAGTSATGWTNDIPVKNLRAYIPVPFNAKAKSVRGTPRSEYTWTLTPIYTKVLQLA